MAFEENLQLLPPELPNTKGNLFAQWSLSLLYNCSRTENSHSEEHKRRAVEAETSSLGTLEAHSGGGSSDYHMTLAASSTGEMGFQNTCMHFNRTDRLPAAIEKAAEAVHSTLISTISYIPALNAAIVFAMCSTCSSDQHTDEETRGMLLGRNDLQLSLCYTGMVAYGKKYV